MNGASPLKRARSIIDVDSGNYGGADLHAMIDGFLTRNSKTPAFRNQSAVVARMKRTAGMLFSAIAFVESGNPGPVNDYLNRYLCESASAAAVQEPTTADLLAEATAANAELIKEREDLKKRLAVADNTIWRLTDQANVDRSSLTHSQSHRESIEAKHKDLMKYVIDLRHMYPYMPPLPNSCTNEHQCTTLDSIGQASASPTNTPWRQNQLQQQLQQQVQQLQQQQQQQRQLPTYSHAAPIAPMRPPPLPPSPPPSTPLRISMSSSAIDDVLARLQHTSWFTIDANNSFQLQEKELKAMYHNIRESLDCIRTRLDAHRVAFDDLRTVVQFYDTLETSQSDGTVDDDSCVELASNIWAKRQNLEYCYKQMLYHLNEACKPFSRAPPYRPYNMRIVDARFVSLLKLAIDLMYTGMGKSSVSTTDPLRVKLTRMCNTPFLLLCLVEFCLSKIAYRVESLTRLYALIQYVDK